MHTAHPVLRLGFQPLILLQGEEHMLMGALAKWLESEFMDTKYSKPCHYNARRWPCEFPKDIPQQDSVNCGVFALQVALRFLLVGPLFVHQSLLFELVWNADSRKQSATCSAKTPQSTEFFCREMFLGNSQGHRRALEWRGSLYLVSMNSDSNHLASAPINMCSSPCSKIKGWNTKKATFQMASKTPIQSRQETKRCASSRPCWRTPSKMCRALAVTSHPASHDTRFRVQRICKSRAEHLVHDRLDTVCSSLLRPINAQSHDCVDSRCLRPGGKELPYSPCSDPQRWTLSRER